MIRILAVTAALLALPGVAPAQTTAAIDQERPVLRSDAVVTGELVRIGDLVDHAGVVARIPIFRAPDLGSTARYPPTRWSKRCARMRSSVLTPPASMK